MQLSFTFRIFAGFGFIVCSLLLCAAYGIQFFFHLEPCLLCLLERYVFMLIALLFFLGLAHNPLHSGRYIYYGLLNITSVLGIFLAGRQIWLQHLPAHLVPNCNAGLERMLQYQPILQALKTILSSSSECAKVDFSLFGLTLAHYSFIAFTGVLLYTLFYCPLKIQRRT